MKFKVIFLLIITIMLTHNSFAVGIFDQTINTFIGATTGWQKTLLPVSQKLFWFISFFEFIYQAAFKKLLPGEIQKLWVWVLTRCLLIFLFAKFVLDIKVYMSIINWLVTLGSDLGGVNLSKAGAISFSVGDVIDQLWGIFSKLIGALMLAAAGAGVLSGPTGQFLFTIATVIIGAILVMAIVISVTIIEAYFVLFGGFFLVAFAGSSWTKSYWEKYLSYVVAVGVRLFFTALILGVLQTTWKDNSWVPKSASEITELPFNLLSMLMVLTLDVVLMVTLPSKAAALMNGAVQAGLGEVMGGAALALSGGKALANPTSAVAGIAKDGIKAAVAAPGGAKKAAYSAMREGLKNNIGGAKDGDLSKFRQSIKDTGQKASSKNTKEGLSNLKDSSINKWKDAAQKSSNSVSTFANKANAADATHSGGSVNVNPHNH